MALFGKKKTEEGKKKEAGSKEKTKATKVVAVVPAIASMSNAEVIIRPRITEKSGLLSQANKYTFEVTKNANKVTVARAVASLYKVTPMKVSMINLPAKNVFVRGKRGVVAGIRKAVVTLKKGDKIDFV